MTITYTEYATIYPTKLTETQFDDLLPSANAYLEVITHGRCNDDDLAEYKLKRAKNALFAVMNAMYANQSISNSAGARVVSVSNDGYSEQYAQPSGDEIRRVAREWLSGTGLMSYV